MQSPPRDRVWEMFDRIAGRYDMANRLLSLGRDLAWRRQFNRHLPEQPAIRVLDLATGTADVLVLLARHAPGLSGIGLDMSPGMLAYAQAKLRDRGLIPSLSLVRGDATCLGIQTECFDAVTMAFGIRNVVNVQDALREMYRVLKPRGRALILEFSLPENRFVRTLYLVYLRRILPWLGGLLSGDPTAYHYLKETVETFPYGHVFCNLMTNAGFRNVQTQPLTFGVATLYFGDKLS